MFMKIRWAARPLRAIAAAAALAVSGAATAGSEVAYNFNNHSLGSFSGSGSSMQYYLDGSTSGTGVGVAITGWQAGRSGCYWSCAPTNTFVNRTNRLQRYGGGIGLDDGFGSPEHGFDNAWELDLLVLQFDTPVALNRVDMGWVYRDWDITVLAHTGAGGPTLNNHSFSYAGNGTSMTNLGWDLVGHYDDNNYNVEVNNGDIVSTFWAIGAFTSSIIDAGRTYGSPDGYDDYFKIRQLVATVADATPVNEAGTLSLLLAGFAGLYWRRRNRAS